MSLQCGLKRVQCWQLANHYGEGVPEGWGRHTESSIPKGSLFGGRDGEKLLVSRSQSPLWGVVLEEVRQVLRGLGMKGFIGEEEQFVYDSEIDREPVEAFEGRGDVLPASCTGEHSGS